MLKGSGALQEELAPSRSEDDVFSNVGECWHSNIAERKFHKLLCPHQTVGPPTFILHTQCCPLSLDPAWCHLFPNNVKKGVLMAGIPCVVNYLLGASCFLLTGIICVLYNQSLTFWGCSHMVRVRLQGISVYFKTGKGRVFLSQKHLILTSFSD